MLFDGRLDICPADWADDALATNITEVALIPWSLTKFDLLKQETRGAYVLQPRARHCHGHWAKFAAQVS